MGTLKRFFLIADYLTLIRQVRRSCNAVGPGRAIAHPLRNKPVRVCGTRSFTAWAELYMLSILELPVTRSCEL